MERLMLLNTLKRIIADTIEIEASDIGETTSLVNELGIESIDMLHIKSRVEATFGIQWDFTSGIANPEATQHGRITKEGAAVLKSQFPGQEFEDLQPGTRVLDIISRITVNTLADSILRHLVRQSEV